MGSTSFTYDGAGNQAAITGGATFAYNTREQTTSITPNGGSPIQMTYSGTGQTDRIGRGSDSFQSDVTGISQETTGGATSYFTRAPSGQLVDERTPSGTYYYLLDGQGSVVGLTNSSGTLVNQYSYDPYGTITSNVEGVSNPFLWIGGVYDSATGLYKLGARYYNPQTASFTQPDGQCEQGCSGSPYAYGSGDPINNEDPTGEMDMEYQGGYGLPSQSQAQAYLFTITLPWNLKQIHVGTTSVTVWYSPQALAIIAGVNGSHAVTLKTLETLGEDAAKKFIEGLFDPAFAALMGVGAFVIGVAAGVCRGGLSLTWSFGQIAGADIGLTGWAPTGFQCFN